MKKISFRMFAYISTLIAITCGLITSCKSEEEKIKDAEELTKTFVSNLKFKNENECCAIYPQFNGIGKYYIINNYRVTSSNIKNDTITIFGKYDRANQETKDIMFVVAENKNHNYEIIASKGISAYWDSPLYKFLKGSGCFFLMNYFSMEEYDKDIADVCNSYNDCWTNLVDFYAVILELSVRMSSHNVSKEFGFISGNMTIDNPTDVNIPAYAYELYINFMNNDYTVLHKEKINNNNIFYAKSKTNISINTNDNWKYKKIGAELKIMDKTFIENFLAKHPTKTETDLKNKCDSLSLLLYQLQNQY